MAKGKIANGTAFALPRTNSTRQRSLLQICASPECHPQPATVTGVGRTASREGSAFTQAGPQEPVLHRKAEAPAGQWGSSVI